MNNIDEKISLLYDSELQIHELDELVEVINNNSEIQKKLSLLSLINVAANIKKEIEVKKTSKKSLFSEIFSNIWFTNGLTAMATLLLTLVFISNNDSLRFNENKLSKNQILSAINSKEAQETIERSDINITDHILRVINDPSYMNTKNRYDLRNAGFNINSTKNYSYSKGKEVVQLRIENKNFGLNKVRYWRYGNKMIYLIPLKNGTAVTIYGNISLNTALEISETLNQ